MILLYIFIFSYCTIVSHSARISNTVGSIVGTARERARGLVIPFANEINPYIKKLFYGEIYFILYNNQYPNGRKFLLDNYENIGINISITSKFLIHGWNSNGDSPMPVELREEYTKLKLYNVIVVDWGNAAKQVLYPIPANGTTIVGDYVADFLLKLYENSTDKNINVHLLGFSLGAHVAGFAGRKLRQHGFTVDRITALDPADPLIFNGVQATDGAFVDVIHTTSGWLGIAKPLGHADFYPNGGVVPQPHCIKGISAIKLLACSHDRSWQYFARTINNPQSYQAYRCESYSEFLQHHCDDEVHMGEGLSINTRGVYYLEIDDVY